MELNSKSAIVTGVTRGLGEAIAIALLQKGAKVFGIARSREKLDIQKEHFGDNFFPVCLDITSQEEVKNWVQENFSERNFPDILINNAGVGFFGKIDELPSEKWHQMVNTNLIAVYYLTSAVVPFMKATKTGSHIINIGSVLGKVSGAEKAGYSATKFALQGFSEALFKELRGDNIKITCVNPGSIDTSFFEDSGIEANKNMLQPKEIAATVMHILETPDNVLIDEISLRPLNPKN